LPGWDSFAVCPGRVRGRDIAPPGHTTALGPRLDATADPLPVPAPAASKLCIGQFGTPTWLSAEPGDRLFFFERPDWLNVVGRRGIVISCLNHVHPFQDGHLTAACCVALIRVRGTVYGVSDREEKPVP
jgi:hypothetical protein